VWKKADFKHVYLTSVEVPKTKQHQSAGEIHFFVQYLEVSASAEAQFAILINIAPLKLPGA